MTSKRIYTVATVNGFTHDEVIGYIAMEFGETSTKDLTEQQQQKLINYLDKDNNTMADKILATGFFGKAPRAGSPVFVKGGVSVKVEEAIKFLNEHKNDAGYVNIDFLENKNDANKWNAFLNDWKPEKKTGTESQKEDTAF